uniref:Uncharacterized protein n=1 Tax=Anguilla anguilla TaxID=7936 RepID=A0A0E9X5E9_ANGAN
MTLFNSRGFCEIADVCVRSTCFPVDQFTGGLKATTLVLYLRNVRLNRVPWDGWAYAFSPSTEWETHPSLNNTD